MRCLRPLVERHKVVNHSAVVIQFHLHFPTQEVDAQQLSLMFTSEFDGWKRHTKIGEVLGCAELLASILRCIAFTLEVKHDFDKLSVEF
jgi:hypothetical protein